jgi:hypothetical protein
MAKIGRRFVFHGAFKSKRSAVGHEKKGEFILGRKIKGHKRYVVVSRRVK